MIFYFNNFPLRSFQNTDYEKYVKVREMIKLLSILCVSECIFSRDLFMAFDTKFLNTLVGIALHYGTNMTQLSIF